ncbi:MAG: SRPBCC domain-containing protein [Candidatus Latescibacterota bacterium]|nr:MAG: SRPBCC domain-containing protein [Candidatus Latescibacterota bacterium]
MKTSDGPIIVEQAFDASIDDVWRAITDIDVMRQWYFENIPSFEPEVGFKTQFNVHSGGRDFMHMWEVTAVDPGRMITYNWRYPDYPGDSFVVWELSEQDNITTLKLTVDVREDFPEDIPEFKRESCVEGWSYFIRGCLKEFLATGR